MLTSRPITPVLPVNDLERAKRFYTNTLGLRLEEAAPMPRSALLATGNAELELLESPERVKSDHTALSFEVDDLEREIQDLESRGVRFEDYDMPGLKTEDHIARMNGSRAAWFKDSEGNVLCLHQRSKR